MDCWTVSTKCERYVVIVIRVLTGESTLNSVFDRSLQVSDLKVLTYT